MSGGQEGDPSGTSAVWKGGELSGGKVGGEGGGAEEDQLGDRGLQGSPCSPSLPSRKE